MNQAGIATPTLHELNGPRHAADFGDAISHSREGNKYAASVYVYDDSEYAGMRLFLADGGKAGFALKGDDIVSVFNVDLINKGSAATMLELTPSSGRAPTPCRSSSCCDERNGARIRGWWF